MSAQYPLPFRGHSRFMVAVTLFVVVLTMHSSLSTQPTPTTHTFCTTPAPWQATEQANIPASTPRVGVADSTCFPITLVAQPDTALRTAWHTVTNDLKKYLPTDAAFAGSLYHVASWSERMVGHWALLWRSLLCSDWGAATTPLMVRSWFYYTDLAERDYQLLALAAFLHPIGLAGDRQFSFDTKEGAALRGAQYLLGSRAYMLADGTPADLPRLLQQLGLSRPEQELVAFLVAAQGLFCSGVQQLFQESQKPGYQQTTAGSQAAQTLLAQLKELGGKLGLSLHLDQKLATMVAIVGAAAARGTQPEEGTTSLLFGPGCQRLLANRPPQAKNPYYFYQYANGKNLGLALKEALIKAVTT